jgi:hypothetical protein
VATLISHIKNVLRRLDESEKRAVTQGSILLQSEIVRGISDARPTGRFYRRGKRFHRASAPGQFPAVDTGVYRASITYLVQRGATGWEGIVGTPMKVGRWLEFGTSRMAPRPHFRPSLLRALPRLRQMKLGVG